MSTFDPHRYTITIKLVTLEEGEHFEAVVSELPDLVEYGETYDRAYSLAVESIASLREAAQEQGREFPAPMPSRAIVEFSGRVTLRMTTSLHACATRFADQDGVSLNSWIVEAIAARVGGGIAASASKNLYSAENAHVFVIYSGSTLVQWAASMNSDRNMEASAQFIEINKSLWQLASSNQSVVVGKLASLQ